jgi:hypothetical protein
MADSYLAIAAIANDQFMCERMYSAATQQAQLGNSTLQINGPGGSDPIDWVNMNKYLWAASPSWGEKWSSALAGGEEEPGKNEAVITDADILATVQALTNPE